MVTETERQEAIEYMPQIKEQLQIALRNSDDTSAEVVKALIDGKPVSLENLTNQQIYNISEILEWKLEFALNLSRQDREGLHGKYDYVKNHPHALHLVINEISRRKLEY
jgi:cAMP phosphodiesterase